MKRVPFTILVLLLIATFAYGQGSGGRETNPPEKSGDGGMMMEETAAGGEVTVD